MKRILILAVVLSTPCFAKFQGFTETSKANGQFLITHFTVSDRAQFHLGCGVGTDDKPFSVIGLKHPSLFGFHGSKHIQLSIDGKQKVSINGGTNEYDDMYYSRNPPKELLSEIANGNSVEVLFFSSKRRVTFSLEGSEQIYTKLWDKCGL